MAFYILPSLLDLMVFLCVYKILKGKHSRITRKPVGWHHHASSICQPAAQSKPAVNRGRVERLLVYKMGGVGTRVPDTAVTHQGHFIYSHCVRYAGVA